MNYQLGTGADAGKVLLTQAGLDKVNSGTDLPAFTLTPSDGTVSGSAVSVDPSVTAVNDAPVLNLTQTNNFTEDASGNAVGSVVATFTTSDAEGSTVTVTLSDTTNYRLGTGTDAGKVLLTQAGLDKVNSGQDLPAFTLTPNDGTVNGTARTVDPAVTAVNDAPTTNNASGSGQEDAAGISLTLSGGDVDGTVASFVIKSLPSNGTLKFGDTVLTIGSEVTATSGSATVTFVPNANYAGEVSFTFAAKDNNGAEDATPGTVTVTVTPVNDDFTDANETISVAEDSTNNTGSLLTGTSSVDGPVTIKSFSITGESGTFTLGTAYTGSGKGSITINADGNYSFTPVANWNGSFPAVTYTVTDGSGTDDTSTLTIGVTAVNDAPVGTSDTLTATEDTAITYTAADLLGNDTDVESQALSIKSVTPGSGGTVVLNEDGTVTFTPSANFSGTASFSYVATDGSADSQATSVTVNVSAVNDAPTTSAVSLTAIAEDSGARTITTAQLLGNASDVEGNTLAVSNVQISSGNGTLVNNNNGTWSYTPASNDDTSVSFSYTITDNGTTNGSLDAKSVTGTATLDITPVNDAPTTSAVTLTAIAEDSGARTITAAQLLGNAADVEGNTLTVSNVQISAGDWGGRIGKGYDALLASVVKGKGAMPARGGTNPDDISDYELGRAVVYLAASVGGKFAEPAAPKPKEEAKK